MRPIRARPARSTVEAAACFLLAAWLCCGLAAAQSDPPILTKVTVRNNYLLAERQIMDMLDIRRGMPFDRQQFESAVARWNSTRVYGTLSFRIEPVEEEAVELVLNVSERVQVTGIAFQGNERLSAKRLMKLTGLEPWVVLTPFEVHEHEREITAVYREEGYPLAAVRAVVRVLEPAERELVFVIAEGQRTWVKEIEFEGNTQVESDELLDVMESRTRGWPSWIWPGWFDEPTFLDDVELIQKAYHDRGYLDAEAGGYVTYSDDMSHVTLRVVAHEGELYRVQEILFEANTIFRDSELFEAIPLAVGQPCRLEDINAAVEEISALYAAQGYMDVTPQKGNLRVEETLPEVGTDVSIRFTITEGEPVFIRRIDIRGLEKTRENVVRRNLTFYPGERASSKKFRESERVLRNTGYFDRQSPRPVWISLEPDEGVLRDAVVEVKEGPTGWFMLGGGAGSESGLIGEISLVEENFDFWNWPSSWNDVWRGNAFRGGGHKLAIMLSTGTKRSYYSISFLNPAVWDTDYSFGTSLYSRGTARNEFDETRTGLSVSGGQQLSKFIRRGVTVGYESIDVDGVSPEASATIRRDEGSHSKPYVAFDFAVDRRDNRFDPTEGHLVSGEVEFAVGGVNTIRLDAQARKYWTVREDRGRNKHVIGVRGRAAVVTAYSGRVPVFERLYAGGFTTLRGFAFEGVSPVDPDTEEQIGGESMLLGSVEYSFPISEQEQLRLVTFADAGYVSEDPEDLLTGWSDLRLGVGVGIRWLVPFLGGTGIEIDLAFPAVKKSGDETRNVHFSLGARRQF